MRVNIQNKDGKLLLQKVELPIEDSVYLLLLSKYGVGNPTEKDIQVTFLLKRLDSMTAYGQKVFHGIAYSKKLKSIEDMINATYQIENYTIVDDFGSLEKIGKRYFFDVECAIFQEEMQGKDFFEMGRNLLESGEGEITLFGILFEQDRSQIIVYDGKHLPLFISDLSDRGILSLKCQRSIEYLSLPTTAICLSHAKARLRIEKLRECLWEIEVNYPEKISVILERETNLEAVNEFCQKTKWMEESKLSRIEKAAELLQAEKAVTLTSIAEHLQNFQVIPDIKSVKEYGEYLIKVEGMYDIHELFYHFIDFEALGQAMIKTMDSAAFTEEGLISCEGERDKIFYYHGEYAEPLECPEESIHFSLFNPLLVYLKKEEYFYEEELEEISMEEASCYINEIKAALKEQTCVQQIRGLMEYFQDDSIVT